LATADEKTVGGDSLTKFTSSASTAGGTGKKRRSRTLFDYSPKKTPISRSADSGESDA
jgi:hypothetical protein